MKFIFKKTLPIVAIVIIVIAIAVSSYFYFQYRKAQKLLQNPTVAASEETKTLVEKVATHMVLPKDENPEIATVSDKSKLADQPFFANSQNGDKVLIYEAAKKAILYRPSIDKIIEVAPVSNMPQSSGSASVTMPNSTPAASTPTQKTVRVAIYNGTKIAGLAGAYGKQLTDKFANIEIVKKDNSKGDYASMLVVDLTGRNSDIAQQIASSVGGKVGTLPETEAKPDADILIIVGK